MKLGIDILIEREGHLLKGRRIGLLAHQGSKNSLGNHTVDLLSAHLTALFGPEHGIATKAQDMEAVGSFEMSLTGRKIPVHSLYGTTLDSLKPTKEMLSQIDVLICDLQDVGSRYYTYIWTIILCLKACAENNKAVIVLDRPNPINGIDVEGALQQNGFESFVGLYQMPVRHGMTIGEMANYINEEHQLGSELHIVKMEGWRREWFWGQTGVGWINPSPNMRSFNAALLYPGMCLVEGTNMSEGRGTDTPFEIIGAPYIDSEEIIAEFKKLKLPGIAAAPTSFIPVRQKHAGKMCHGVRWVITDEKEFKPYLTGLAFIWLVNKLYKNTGFAWRSEEYEFVVDKPAIDLLTGSSFFRENIDKDFQGLISLSKTPEGFIMEKRRKTLLY